MDVSLLTPADARRPVDDAEPLLRDLVLVASPDGGRRRFLAEFMQRSGWLTATAGSTQEVVWELSPAHPHLVVVDVPGPQHAKWALEVVDHIRARARGEDVPVVLLAAQDDRLLTLSAFARRADDVIPANVPDDELVARLRVRLERPPVTRGKLAKDPITGALTEPVLKKQIEHELERLARGGRPGVLALLQFDELPELEATYGSRVREEILAQVVALIEADSRDVDFVGTNRGVLAILMPATPSKGGLVRLDRLSRLLSTKSLHVAGTFVRLTPIIGYAVSEPGISAETFSDRAWRAMMHQAEQLDLFPTHWAPHMEESTAGRSRLREFIARFQTGLQITVQQIVCLILPFWLYIALSRVGVDITGYVYYTLVGTLAMTAAAIWVEGVLAVRREEPPEEAAPPPPATAIIAAYLPNEAATVIETVEAFLEQDYPDLQIILAYNTPTPLPVEDELRAIAELDSRLELFHVEGSISKAQNVNAALARARGEVIGVFDADHHPDPRAFRRAWQWISNGADVVQGHCVVRNGDTNWVTRLVAVEFEAIYAVAHPGRARLHQFGIFGGSNGYWRAELLRRKRMRGFMLTEDIDSSMRVVEAGGTIISDPGLISTELAPDTARALWNQRMRWAQGWTQVSLRHLRPMFRRPDATLRSRIGAIYLLAWREVYPWVSLQIFPLLAFWLFRGKPTMNWFVPIFVITTVFTLSAGPAQVYFASRLAHPSIKRHRSWFVYFFFASVLFYTELKNVIVRTAHLKELMGDRTWKVTPRSVQPKLPTAVPAAVERRSPTSVGAALRADGRVSADDAAVGHLPAGPPVRAVS